MPESQNSKEQNESQNSYQYNPNRPQNNPNEEHADTKKVVDTAAKGAAEYFAPGVGGMAYDAAKKVPGVGNAIDKTTDKVAEVADQVPGVKKVTKGLNDSGITDAANKGIDLIGSKGASGGANALKNAGGSAQAANMPSGGSKAGVPVSPVRKNSIFNSMIRNGEEEDSSSSESLPNEENLDDQSESVPPSEIPTDDLEDNHEDKQSEDKNAKGDIAGQALNFIWDKYKIPIILGGGGIAFFFIILIVIFGGGVENSNSGLTDYLNSCSSFPMNETTLSKSEFVELASTYLTENYTSSSSATFADNLEIVYEVGTSNNINPELIVVRAVVEGFSPGNSNYNYWGLGCYNGASSSDCLSYSTFKEGVEAFVQNVSQYDTVVDMMSRYAYIGSYWYNPGSSGLGGCYYYSYISEYMSDSRASTVANVCNSSTSCTKGNTASCTATTDEDQEAYAMWQVKKMSDVRKNIFGLDPEICSQFGNYSTYNLLAKTSDNLDNVLTTSLKSALRKQGMSVEDFNDYLLSNILAAGVGTRSAAVTAAISLVWTLYDAYGIRIPYTMCGQHYCSNVYMKGTTTNVNRSAISFYGIDPNWGVELNPYRYGDGLYSRYGPDCSGFVSWILHNAGFDNSHVLGAVAQGEMGPQYSLQSYVGQPGDVLSNSEHIMFIVGVDTENELYYVAHASGGSSGTKISTLSFSNKSYKITDMTSWYANHAVYTEENEEEFIKIYQAGYVLD